MSPGVERVIGRGKITILAQKHSKNRLFQENNENDALKCDFNAFFGIFGTFLQGIKKKGQKKFSENFCPGTVGSYIGPKCAAIWPFLEQITGAGGS